MLPLVEKLLHLKLAAGVFDNPSWRN